MLNVKLKYYSREKHLFEFIQREIIRQTHSNMCTEMFMLECLIVKIILQPKRPSVEDCINNLWYILPVECNVVKSEGAHFYLCS